MTSPANLIAANLQALPHPDGTPRTLAGFNSQLLPEALKDQVDKTAADIGECIVYLLESSGYHILSDADLAATTDEEPTLIGHVHCTNCDTRLFDLNLTNPGHILTNGQWLLEALGRLKPGCPHR